GGSPRLPPTPPAARPGRPPTLPEKTAVLGRATGRRARRATMIAGAFPGLSVPAAKPLVVTGNPVRPAIAAVGRQPYRPPGDEDPLHLLVLGGSQGARVFSRVVPAAIALLPPSLRTRLILAQQCRPEDIDAVRDAYEELGVSA